MSHFLEKYNVTGIVDNEPLDGMFLQANTGKNRFLYNLILQHGGKIFDNGLFKIHTFKYV
jgi:hypothetical protein